jgi:4-hydroxybenzoate polyprenyltransferase
MRFATFKELTRLEHTVFALPFVLGGAFLALAEGGLSINWAWILPAFFLARISGMAFNHLIDRAIDARNPRTQNRMIPSGRATVGQARLVAWGALFLFIVVCFQINSLTAPLALVAALLIYLYSYMKRIHYISHFVLGSIHFLGPVMAYAALMCSCPLPPIFLGGAACLLIAGSDIIYAIQDYEFDCTHHLFSIPAKFGIEKSLVVAASLHFLSLLMLLGVGVSAHLSLFYYFVLPAAFLIYLYFHLFLHKHKGSIKKVERAFFLCNVTISFSTLFFVGASCLWRVLS